MASRKNNSKLQAETAKVEPENRYKFLFQYSADPLLIMNEKFIDCNEEACHYWGYRREEIIGRSPIDFSPERQPGGCESAEAASQYVQDALKGIPRTFYWQHLHRSGKLLDTEVRLRKVDIEGEALIIASVRDVSERLRAEDIIRQGRDWYRALAEDIPVLVTRISPDGEVTYINELSRTIIDRPVDEIIGKDFYALVPAEYRNQVRESFQALTPEESVVTYEHYNKGRLFRWKNRAIFNPDRTIKEYFTVGEDITEQHEAAQKLKDSEARNREILATIEEGYYEADLGGMITFCNEASGRLYDGLGKNELIGTSYKKLYKDPDLAFKAFNRVIKTGVPEKGLILEMIKKDRTTRVIEVSISLVRDKKGLITGFKGIAKDVTERIEYEKRLQYLSLHDQLTGIHNRACYESELERLEGGREYPVTIITADLDGLKFINDTLGHYTGDQLLCRCAKILGESLRRSDLLARIGGDEFSAILCRTDKATGETILRRIREKLTLINKDDDVVPLGISIGMATAESADLSLKEAFRQADDCMYRDKLCRSSSSRGKIVQSLLAALAERDYIAEGHARRLENLCRAMGEKIGLTSYQLADLVLLAQVHDLGKVGIPDQILYKSGPLNDDEWEVMRGHPEKGYRIASASPDLAGIADLILKHHERWDGSGYPMGLRGAEIPIDCRILAIIDAYDAMTNKRTYNKVKSHDEALAEIKNCSNSQFDSDLVAIFLFVIEEI